MLASSFLAGVVAVSMETEVGDVLVFLDFGAKSSIPDVVILSFNTSSPEPAVQCFLFFFSKYGDDVCLEGLSYLYLFSFSTFLDFLLEGRNFGHSELLLDD